MERFRFSGVLDRKPMWRAIRFLAARKKRWKIVERDDMVLVRSFVEGMFMSRVVRQVASEERVVGGVCRRWRVESGFSCGAVKRMEVFFEFRRARLRVVIARVQAGSQLKVAWGWRVCRMWIRRSSATSCSLRSFISCKDVVDAKARRRRDWSWFCSVRLICSWSRWLCSWDSAGLLISRSSSSRGHSVRF